MDIGVELVMVAQIIVAFVLSGIIGFEHEMQENPAGIRTYAAVTLTAVLLTLIGVHSPDATASSRIMVKVVTGIGFMGAGIIYNNIANRPTHGLTTASSIWGAAGIGVAVAYNMYFIAVGATVAIYFLLALQHVKWYIKLNTKA